MPTAADIINLALKDIEVIGEAETASAETLADALTTMNQMLALWSVSGVNVYTQVETSFTPTGALSYTVGPSGNFNISRPSVIDHVYWRSGDIDYPIHILDTFEEYQDITSKTLIGQPIVAFYLPAITQGVLYVYPQPNTGSLKITTRVKLPVYAAAADTLAIPPEFELAVRSSLAELLSINMGKKLRPDIAALATKTRKIMKRNNLKIKPLEIAHGHLYNVKVGSGT